MVAPQEGGLGIFLSVFYYVSSPDNWTLKQIQEVPGRLYFNV